MNRARFPAVLLLGSIGLVWMERPALAACEEWAPRALITGDKTPLPAGVLTNPRDGNLVRDYHIPDFAKHVEVRDGAGRPVTLPGGPGGSWRALYGTSHAPEWPMSLTSGVPGKVRLHPWWLRFPAAGTYQIRFGFEYPDLPPDWRVPKHGPGPKYPMCMGWSDWTTVEIHPFIAFPVGAGPSPGFGPMAVEGVVVTDDDGRISWWYLDGILKRVEIGRTSERPRKPVPSDFGYADVDARVDTIGRVHVVYAAGPGKTTYLKLGARGVVLERTELPGRKGLGGPRGGIVLVDKPSAAPSSKVKP